MQWCFIKKQIGGNRDGRKESAKVHFSFDSPVKKLYKRKRKLLRFRDLQLISSVSLLIKIKSFYEVYTWNSLIYGLPVGVILAYPILGKRLFSRAELRVETACNNAMLRN